MTKNQRIASCIQTLIDTLGTMRGILLEKEETSPIQPTKMVKAGMEWSNKKGKWVPRMESVPFVQPPSPVIKPSDNWKEQMTEEINENNRKLVESVTKSPVVLSNNNNPIEGKHNNINCKGQYFSGIVLNGKVTYSLIHSNSQVNYYQCLQGRDAGTVLRVNKKTNKVVDDGRWNGKTSGRLALVTTDANGKSYVRQMVKQIRDLVPKRNVKIRRNYRPVYHWSKSNRSKRKFCAIYTTVDY